MKRTQGKHKQLNLAVETVRTLNARELETVSGGGDSDKPSSSAVCTTGPLARYIAI